MKRSYLKIGDKSSAGGTVIEGIPLMRHHGKELTFVGAIVVCPACKSDGRIVAKGPRWPDDLMGKHAALEDDICSCKCSPPPVMIASQSDMTMSFKLHELASMGYGPSGTALPEARASDYWVRFALRDRGNCKGLRCRAHFSDGTIEEGVFDSSNRIHFARSNASPCQKVEVVFNHTHETNESVMIKLLRSMAG
jgi:uncharacterized Zn-binding protein involved in type VI secretion